MNKEKKTIRHALILVFEYRFDITRIPQDVQVEEELISLLAMFLDLVLMYRLAREKFGIEEENITIITDVRPPPGQKYPWTMKRDGKNVNLIRLNYPCIEAVTRGIAQFVENTIRGIEDLPITKGSEFDHEIFFYASGHGALIPASLDMYGFIDDEDTSLIFFKRKDNLLKRAYLRRQDIFSILFGHINVEEDGTMRIPYTTRSSKKINHIKTFNYSDSYFKITLTPTKSVDDRSTRLEYNRNNRGLPVKTNLLCIIDTCHSASITDFHFVYDPGNNRMIQTNKMPIKYPFPVCICISASEDSSEAPSTSNGSPFTRSIFNIFSTINHSASIKLFHEILYDSIPKISLKCKPTITATTSSIYQPIPFINNLPCRDDHIVNKNDDAPVTLLLSEKLADLLARII